MKTLHTLFVATLLSAVAPALAAAQAQLSPGAIAKTACGTEVAPPAALPPAGSPPFIWILELCFDRQGGASTVDNDTYLYWIKLQTSQTKLGQFVPYDDRAEEQIIADFKALWATNFLEDLSIEKTEHTFENGTVGVMMVYRMEERERVKIVDYRNTKGDSISIIKRSDIDDKLRERNIEVRLDSFLDDSSIRRVKGVLRELMAEKGFTNAEINHKVTPVAGGPKLVNVTFTVGEGPKIKIREVDFIGNTAMSDGKLEKKMKENKPKGFLSFITGGGTYKESMYEEDAARVVEFYFWHWNLNSVLLEVALCIMAYTVVLWLELAPAFLARGEQSSNARIRTFSHAVQPWLRRGLVFIIAIGILLPTMHQSSLGSLMLLAGPRLHPLWNTPILPLLFLVSCIGMGYAAVVMESTISARALHRAPERRMLAGLGFVMIPVQALYVVLRLGDLAYRGQLGALFAFDAYSIMALLEIALFTAAPVMLLSESRRRNLGSLFRAAMVLLLAGALYRIDTFLVAFNPGSHWSYFPSVGEILITVGLVAIEIVGYILIVRYFPILSGQPAVRRAADATGHVAVRPA